MVKRSLQLKHKPWRRRYCISSQLSRGIGVTGAMVVARFAGGRARVARTSGASRVNLLCLTSWSSLILAKRIAYFNVYN